MVRFIVKVVKKRREMIKRNWALVTLFLFAWYTSRMYAGAITVNMTVIKLYSGVASILAIVAAIAICYKAGALLLTKAKNSAPKFRNWVQSYLLPEETSENSEVKQ